MTFLKTALFVGALTVAAHATANAVVITAQLVPPNGIPFALVPLGAWGTPGPVSSLPVVRGGETISFTGGTPAAGIYYGTVAGAMSPYDNTSLAQANYLAAEPGGSVNIGFSSPQTEFDLLWGSVDDYNSISFTFGGGFVITGTDIANAVTGINFGHSNAAVEIKGLTPFTSLMVLSSKTGFEFVPGVPVGTAVPEPASMLLVGMGLIALGATRRVLKAA